MLAAGHSSNAIPERATATVNIRVSPGHPVTELIEWITVLVDDPGIEVEVVEARDASPVSPATGPAWDRLAKHVRAVYGDVLVVPYVNNGGTDSRNYTGISDFVYRFNPVDMTLAERGTLHAVDERLRISSFVEALEFYRGFVADL
jgi:carboxypeptidase PM20D1